MPAAEINNVWATQSPTGTVENHTLPSGQIVNAKKISVQDLLLAGVITESDALTQFVQKHHLTSGRVKPEDATAAIMDDPTQFGTLMMLMDRVMPHVIVEPKVRVHFIDIDKPTPNGPKTRIRQPAEREDDIVYTDQIPFGDKLFLLTWSLGDVSQAMPFRAEPPAAVADVEDVAGVPHHGQQRPGNKPRRKR